MISAFEVYLVMQLDSVRGAIELLSVLSGLATLALIGYSLFCHQSNPDEWYSPEFRDAAKAHKERAPAVTTYAKRMATAFCVLVCINALVPPTKTAAAMIVLPALSSDTVIDAVTPEVKELLGLTKEALKAAAVTSKEPAKDGEAKKPDVEG